MGCFEQVTARCAIPNGVWTDAMELNKYSVCPGQEANMIQCWDKFVFTAFNVHSHKINQRRHGFCKVVGAPKRDVGSRTFSERARAVSGYPEGSYILNVSDAVFMNRDVGSIHKAGL